MMLLDIITEKFFKPKAFLGCDIGTTSIKLIELERGLNNSTAIKNYGLLESYGHFERSNNVIQANDLKISAEETGELLRALVKKTKFNTPFAVASIPSFGSFITTLEMPQMSEQETGKAMAFQIKQNIPLPLSDIAVDWVRVGAREDENGFTKQQILLIAIPNETIERYRVMFKKAGLRLRALEVECLSYARSVVGGDKTPTMVLDIGARSSNITIIDQGFVKQNVQIDYAGDTLTHAIAKGLGIQSRRAEELKKQKGLLGGRGEYELSTLEIPFIDAILHEVEIAKVNVEQTFGVLPQRCLIIGGGANLLGLPKYAEEKLQIPTMIGNGLLYTNAPRNLQVVEQELGSRFATAIGLAIKGFL